MIRRLITRNPAAVIAVTGCMAQTAHADLARIPGVDFIGGNGQKMRIVPAVLSLLEQNKKNDEPVIQIDDMDAVGFEAMSITKFDRTRAYVKIEDGCESRCTYCIIPKGRGRIRSKKPEEVLDEVRTLTSGGCREVVLTGIETASYGKDLSDYHLSDLLRDVDAVPGIGRVRLGSLDPSLMKQPFVDKIASLSSLAPHFHISMQSGSDAVLRNMKRKYNAAQAYENICRLRAAIPDVMLTTDMIVGFPGETQEDFEATMEFARKARFLMIHVFPFSARKGTPAAAMPGKVPEPEKHRRAAALSALAAEIRLDILNELVAKGRPVDVLFEDFKDGYAYGHTASFVEVRVKSECSLHSKTLPVRLLSTDGNVVEGEIV